MCEFRRQRKHQSRNLNPSPATAPVTIVLRKDDAGIHLSGTETHSDPIRTRFGRYQPPSTTLKGPIDVGEATGLDRSTLPGPHALADSTVRSKQPRYALFIPCPGHAT